MLAFVVKTPDRDEYLNFTTPYLNIDVVVVGKKELKLNTDKPTLSKSLFIKISIFF